MAVEGQTAFLERCGELTELVDLSKLAASGQAQVCLVHGEVGTGKSTLLHAVQTQCEANEGLPRFLLGRCDDITAAVSGRTAAMPFQPFKSILEQLVGIDGSSVEDVPDSRVPAVRRAIHAVVGLGPELIGAFVPVAGLALGAARYLADESGIVDRIKQVRPIEPSENFAGLAIDRFTAVLLAVAADGPLVVAIDDMHWADDGTLALFGHLARRLLDPHQRDSRVLLIGAFRPPGSVISEAAESLRNLTGELRRQGVSRVDLDALTEDCKDLFCNALVDGSPNDLKDDFRVALAKRTGGNPLFASELLLLLRRDGTITQAEGRATLTTAVDWDRLPDAVEAAVERRVRVIDQPLRELLEAGSILGYEFLARDLADVVGRSEQDVLADLDSRLSREFSLIRSVEAGDGTVESYEFRHGLVRAYIYGQIGDGSRRMLHRSVYSAFASDSERAEGMPLLMVLHATHAGLRAEAIHWTLVAAQKAFGRQELVSVFRLAEEVLTRVDSWPTPNEQVAREIIDLHLLAVDVQTTLYELAGAPTHAERALKLAQLIGDRRREAKSYLQSGIAAWKARDYAAAETFLDAGISIADEEGDSETLASLQGNMGIVYNRTRRHELALRAYELALELDPNRRRQARNNSAVVLGSLLGRYDEAIALYEWCCADARTAGQYDCLMLYLRNLNSYRRIGEYDRARVCLQEAIDLARMLGDIAADAAAVEYLGSTIILSDGPEAALPLFEESLVLVETARSLSIDRQSIEILAYARIGLCQLLLNNVRAAVQAANHARRLQVGSTFSDKDIGTVGIVYGMTLLALKSQTNHDLPKAVRVFELEVEASAAEPREYWAPRYNYAIALTGLTLAKSDFDSSTDFEAVHTALGDAISNCGLVGIRHQAAIFFRAMASSLPPVELARILEGLEGSG